MQSMALKCVLGAFSRLSLHSAPSHPRLPTQQVLIQDTILKWRRSVSSASLSRMDILLEPKQGQQAQQGDHEEAGLLDGVPTSTAA